MKTALYSVMLAALLAAGCIPRAPFTWPDDSDAAAARSEVRPEKKHATAVRADQVTPENAREMARMLKDEMEHDDEAPK
jgi:hypothetical protein